MSPRMEAPPFQLEGPAPPPQHAEDADLVDRRQRQAAAILLSAITLPAPAHAVASLWLRAAEVCPGISAEEVCLAGSRVGALRFARDLIDDVIAELEVRT
jgi:hypothetical protein